VLVSALAVLVWPFGARAEVAVRAPFVNVRVGPGVYVRAPYVRLDVPARPEAVPVPDEPPLPPRVLPVEPELRPRKALLAVPTPAEFVAAFVPAGGNYEVVLRHPFTGLPVKVRFSLPPGKPRKVRASRLRIVFDYGRKRVTIRFFRNGSVRVRS
jgi:hypothetical protein